MFENLNEYYDYLEQYNNFIWSYSISNKLNSLIEKTENDSEKQLLSYEMFFNDLNFEKGKLIPKYSLNGKSYPELSLFDDDFQYIISRASSKNFVNPRNKAKYYHILWESPKKNIEYAKQAIDNYFIFIKGITLPKDDNLINIGFTLNFENLFVLSVNINYRIKEIIEFLINHLNNNELNGFQKYSLMLFVLLKSKKLNKEYQKLFFVYAKSVIVYNLYPEFTKEYLNLLILLCSKSGTSSKEYLNKLGDTHIQESEKHKESFLVHDFYLKALKQYQKAGNKEKVEEVTILIEKAKDNLNLKSIKSEHSSPELQIWYDNLKAYTTDLTEKGESKDIYEHLMLAQIFPKANVLDQKVKSVMMDFVNTMSFDINRNISGPEKSGINSYNIHIQNFTLRHLWLVFSKGSKNGKINFESLIDFLKNYTWYGIDFSIKNPAGELETYNWLELLTPPLDSYFKQSEIDIKTNKNCSSGYILSIDSLVLKFEGVLREFSRYIGAQTIEIKENGTSERVNIEKLLENEKFKKLVPEDDIALFKFLFTSDGINLRNNIAHCFFKSKDYSAAIMWLLICAFLRLGNYTLKIDSK